MTPVLYHDKALKQICEKLNGDAQRGRVSPSAGVWLLDNYSLLHAQARELREALSRRFWRKLGKAGEKPRIYELASQLVERSEAKFALADLQEYFADYQRTSVLTLAELWAIQPVTKLALLDLIVQTAAHLESSDAERRIANAITTLRALDQVSWNAVVEKLSAVHAILREDPAGVYGRMNFETRDLYRHAVERSAERRKRSEVDVARELIERARNEGRHVGFLLGQPLSRPFSRGVAQLLYFGGLAILTAGLVWLTAILLGDAPWWLVAMLLVPLSQVALSILHPLVTRFVTPDRMPRMDFSRGIPAECRSFVVIPTLLLSRSGVESLLERIEIHYLANRDPHLLFGLLTDVADANEQTRDQDQELVNACAQGIRELNLRYGQDGAGPFYLFHRGREFNPSEGVWMGRERKRGKLDDFNDFLEGISDPFPVKTGNVDRIFQGVIRYVITLDTDTRLPRDSASDLIANIAHPLNHKYGLLQPRVSISMESAQKSRLANLMSGQTGLDPYTKAVSDVYQDLFRQASYTGKGIYDLAKFTKATRGRFPDNTLLSHDLIEGEHVRVGLVTDVEVIDDYPKTYEAFSKRKHRWVRGDWQIAIWLLPWVPDARWRWGANRLSMLSRWKIFDNLRRSVYELALVAFFAAALFGALDPYKAALAVAVILLAPAVAPTFFSLLRLPPVRFLRTFLREAAWQFARGVLEQLVMLAFLLHQAILMADAIGRTLLRRLVTRRRLLEWESAAQAEAGGGTKMSLVTIYLLACPFLATALAFVSPDDLSWLPVIVLAIWAASPVSAEFISHRMRFGTGTTGKDLAFLREISLRTWRYFLDFSKPEQNWLTPDNVQEDPFAIATRSSPTNMGLQLVADTAAHEFGYLTTPEFSERVDRVVETINGLERHRGNLYNWYDTRSLAPLAPRYVSSVDNGNLAASLITLKQSCLEIADGPAIGCATIDGLGDHAQLLRISLPHAGQTAPLMKDLLAVSKQLACEAKDLFYFEGLLTELQKMLTPIEERVIWLSEHWLERRGQSLEQARYWMRALRSRVDANLAVIHDFAPWLKEPLEQELRALAAAPAMQKLMKALGAIPKVSGLESHYDAIEREVNALQAQQLPDSTRRILDELIAAIGPARNKAAALNFILQRISVRAGELFDEMDFGFLLDRERKLMRIGFNADSGEQEDSHYDLLASEARTSVFLAVAKGDFPRESWFRLGRKITTYRGHRTLVSWSGTMFEYLMPNLFLKSFEESLLTESLAGAVRIQRLYAGDRHLPWGVSEAAHSGRDAARNYQYRAFGLPMLGLKRMGPKDLVIAPYASMLALMVDPGAAIANLRHMAERGWLGDYGFYESVDFSDGQPEVIRAFMVHHQGMGFAALANTLRGNVIQRWFHADPLVRSTELLLQERLPVMFEETPMEETLPERVSSPLAEVAPQQL